MLCTTQLFELSSSAFTTQGTQTYPHKQVCRLPLFSVSAGEILHGEIFLGMYPRTVTKDIAHLSELQRQEREV